MTNTAFKFGPVVLTTTTTTNILNPGTTTGGTASTAAPYDKTYVILRKMRVANNSATAAFVALWLGATGTNTVGKEFVWAGTATAGALDANRGASVPANSYLEWVGYMRLSTADFLVGGTGTASVLTLEGEGEIGIGA